MQRIERARLLSEKEVEREFGISARRLQGDRFRKSDGIPFIKIGRSVRYDRADILEYLERNKHRSTSDQTGNSACYIHSSNSLSAIGGTHSHHDTVHMDSSRINKLEGNS
jgi:predicted DNA-binding transcriptional regulator AlpA